MARGRTCKQLRWRDEDPVWKAERENDRRVFAKIRRERMKGQKVAAIIRELSRSELWAARMRGKTAESWRRKFNGWWKNHHSPRKVGRCASGNIFTEGLKSLGAVKIKKV